MRGKAEKSTRFVLALREQPRVCGENWCRFCFMDAVDGTTPRVRGKDFTTSGFIEQLSSFQSTFLSPRELGRSQ